MVNDATNFIKIWRLDLVKLPLSKKNKDKKDQPDA